MRQVIQYQKTGEMFIGELPAPQLRPGGILVQNIFSLISAGTEKASVKTAQASMVGKAKSRPDLVKQVLDNVKRQGVVSTYKKVQNRLDNYKQLGYSSAGIVVESASGEFKSGDRVACAGGGYALHAEYIFVPKNLAVKIPDDVSFEDAACATLCSIALQGVRQAEVDLGEYVAVIGLGLVGLIVVQLLAANGCRVIGLDISEINFDLAKKMGCEDCLVSDFDAITKVLNFTKGRGTDAVIITAATQSNQPIEAALEVARKKSKIVVVGDVKMDIPRGPFYEKELELRNSCSYGPGRYDPDYEEKGMDYPIGYVRWTERRNLEACLDLMSQKKLDLQALVSHKFKIEDALQAYDIIMGKAKKRYLGILIEYPKDHENGRLEMRRVILQDRPNATLTSNELCVGFIGAGNFAQSFLLPALQKLGIRPRGVATSRPVNAQSVAKKFNFDYFVTDPQEILDDKEINSIFVATRHDSHAKYVIESLKRGKNVYVEKPLAISREQADEIFDLYNKRSKNGKKPFLMVGYNRRFSPPMVSIKEFFKNRKEPLVMNYRVNAGFLPKTNWYQEPEQGGRVIGEIGHFVDTMQFLTGALPVQVYTACMQDPGNRYSHDNVNVTIAFTDGSIGTISYVSNGASALEKEYLEVFGEGKTILMESFKRVKFFKGRKKWKKSFPGNKGHTDEITAVSKALQMGDTEPIGIDSLMATTYISLAAIESLNQGNSMTIEIK
ncbi:MAG: bi-domain-containing oxidoreductase [Bacteroidetes bacterium]|nr:bi-domain-containing oxidoreductase [Bacteroidota bacterium]